MQEFLESHEGNSLEKELRGDDDIRKSNGCHREGQV
jgi:hypothetical protein